MKNFEAEIFDSTLTALGIIQGISECQYSLSNSTNGSFLLVCSITKENLIIIKQRYFVVFDNNDNNVFMVEYFRKIKSGDGVLSLLVQGRSAIALMARRIVWNTYCAYNQKVGKIINDLLYQNAMAGATDTARNIPIWIKDVSNDAVGGTLTLQSTGDNLLLKITELCIANNVSIYCTLDRSNKLIRVYVRANVNHNWVSANPVVFSAYMDNIISSEYTYNEANYFNSYLVAGAGEGTTRKKYNYIEGTGLTRREIYVDARDISLTDAAGATILNADYFNMLAARGSEVLSGYKIIENFTAELEQANSQFVYGADFELGDTVTTIDEDLEITTDVQVTGYKRIFNQFSESTSFTFGESQPTLYDLMQRRK